MSQGFVLSDIRLIDVIEFADTKLNVTLPPYSAAMVVVGEDVTDFPVAVKE